MSRYILTTVVALLVGIVGTWLFLNRAPAVIPAQNTNQVESASQILTGTFVYTSLSSIPGYFYFFYTDPAHHDGQYITFRNYSELTKTFGIDTRIPIGDNCDWVTPTTIEVSNLRAEKVNDVQTIAGTLERVISKEPVTKKCPN